MEFWALVSDDDVCFGTEVSLAMTGFNRTELDRLESREIHLTILSAIIVLVMAGGVALLMYPLVFVHPDQGDKWTLRFAFVGFCVLSILFVIYLLDRQRTFKRLKQQLVAQLDRNLELRHQADVDLLHNLQDMSHFQDRLTMEYRRASSMQRPLSLIVVRLKFQQDLGDKDQTAALGEVARCVSRSLRPTDSMYLLGRGLFGLLLPDSDTAAANSATVQLEQALGAVGATNKFSFATFICNYPNDAKSAHEMEASVLSLVPERDATLIGVDLT